MVHVVVYLSKKITFKLLVKLLTRLAHAFHCTFNIFIKTINFMCNLTN